MVTDRLPLRARVAVAALVALALVAVGGATAVLEVGAGTLQVTDGNVESSAATSRTWFGLELENPSSFPVTLRFVRPAVATNARVVAARILDHQAGAGGVGVVSPPVGGRLGAAIAAASPVDGFVVPAHSRSRYQLILLVEQIEPGTGATLRQTDIGFTALGLDHGFRSHAVVCIRAPGKNGCS